MCLDPLVPDVLRFKVLSKLARRPANVSIPSLMAAGEVSLGRLQTQVVQICTRRLQALLLWPELSVTSTTRVVCPCVYSIVLALLVGAQHARAVHVTPEQPRLGSLRPEFPRKRPRDWLDWPVRQTVWANEQLLLTKHSLLHPASRSPAGYSHHHCSSLLSDIMA